MKTTHQLSGSHLSTYNTIFQHPISHNLEWRAVRSLLEHLGQVTEQGNGNLKVTRNGHTIMVHPDHRKDVEEMDEIMALRHFLERSECLPPMSNDAEAHWLLVIDHHEARIFHSEMHGTAPEQILPSGTKEYFRHAYGSKDFTRGEEKPDPNTFFEPVAAALQGAGQILIFGTGKGMSSEMDQFHAWVQIHLPLLAARVIGCLLIDEHHLSSDQLLAKARDFYSRSASRSGPTSYVPVSK